jgi:hypothetical protein
MSVAQSQNGAGKRPETSVRKTRPDRPAGSAGLEQHLRDSVSEFDFAVLLGGVSSSDTNDSTAARGKRIARKSSTFLPRPSAIGPAAPNRKLFYLTSALISAVTALVVSAGFQLAMYRSGPVHSSADRAADARSLAPAFCLQKGMPEPATTPGEGGLHMLERESVSHSVKREVFARYGLELGDPRYVTAYLIPGSLGGTNRPANLFPIKPWFLILKKRLDRAITNEVMDGRLTVAEARREITTDWLAAMRKRNLRNHGQTSARPSPPSTSRDHSVTGLGSKCDCVQSRTVFCTHRSRGAGSACRTIRVTVLLSKSPCYLI